MVRTTDIVRVDRRSFMKASAATGAALAAGSVFAPAVHAAKSIKIGYVSPQTGPRPPSPKRTISSSRIFSRR
jgi:anaerobic selenocysteine-containing dehydrogenase